jgi:LmbE family N-acetylglucosaminyl deacetylase
VGRYAILAPHVDDEVIGCYRLLAAGEVESVLYFFELTEERIKEGNACAKRFGFQPIFLNEAHIIDTVGDIRGYTILVPHVADQHPHHRTVNRVSNNYVATQLKFYSVDMNVTCDVLDEETRRAKRDALYELFPSQQPLFNQDSKYFLFESLLDTDWVKMKVRDSHFAGSGAMWVRPDDD